jgi:hypothetical protein
MERLRMVRLRNVSQNPVRNRQRGEIGNVCLYFSCGTIVAFRTSKTGLVVSENIWGSTTEKHLNWIVGWSGDCRIPYDEFEKQLNELLESRGIKYW